MKFLDTNVFLRYITGDDSAKTSATADLFQHLDVGAIWATTSESVVAEIAYVLSSPTLYHLSHADIRDRLVPLLTLSGLTLPHKSVILRALDLYTEHPFLDIEDALSISHMEDRDITEIVSYDRDFDRICGIRRVEP